MKTSRLLLPLIAASLLAAPLIARAQQYAAQSVCQIPLDGGTGSVSTTCGPILTNYQPLTATCQIGPNKETVNGTIQVLTSGDGVHFGVPTSLIVIALPDGGQPQSESAFLVGNASGTATQVPATDIMDVTIDPTDPYQYVQFTANTKADGGTNDGINCYVSVVQAQTLHAPHNLKGTLKQPAGVKAVNQ
jgi:hypothetical protein